MKDVARESPCLACSCFPRLWLTACPCTINVGVHNQMLNAGPPLQLPQICVGSRGRERVELYTVTLALRRTETKARAQAAYRSLMHRAKQAMGLRCRSGKTGSGRI